jgi:hypothetical protein
MNMEYLTLVNRTSKSLQGTWNGRQFEIVPGKSLHPKLVAEAIKRQNPLMGSQGSEIYETIYLCGIEEYGDDISSLEQSTSKELMDPAILHGGKVMQEVSGVSGMYQTRAAVAADLPAMSGSGAIVSGFEKP